VATTSASEALVGLPGVRKRVFWALGLGAFGLAFSLTTTAAYLPPLLHRFTSSGGLIGVILGAEGIFALTISPVIGPWSDGFHTPLGRRRPFMLVAVFPMGFCLLLMPFMPNLWTTVVIVMSFFFAYYLYETPYRGLYPDVLPPQTFGRSQSVQHIQRGIAIGIALVGGGLLFKVWRPAPFVLAAPSGEAEIFLATQLVDEARHAAFFDRFMAEVMALDGEDIRGRLAEMEQLMLPAWRTVFDDHLRETARRLLARPDDLDLFVEGIVTYHVVIEGVLAMTGQHQILKYLEAHDIYPGFCRGFSLVEQDEHRHIAFGVRFLKDACDAEPRYRAVIERKIAELVPVACHVFVPPGTEDPGDFMSYDYHSSEIYGFAYRALKRRMAVVGVEVPPAEELMPGPIAAPAIPHGAAAVAAQEMAPAP